VTTAPDGGANNLDDLFEAYRATEFAAATAAGIGLNHAGVGPASARVVTAVEEAVRAMGRAPLAAFMELILPKMTAAREKLARMMGVPQEHLAFTRNTAHGLSLVADGLALEPGDNIVTAACEYPAVVYPWYAQKWRGIETRLVPLRADSTLHPDDFAAHMDDRTRVVALSWVQFGTGYRADMTEYAALAHRHGAILVADIIQGLGALPCDVTAWGADVAATSAYKWLMALPGMGALYVAPHVMERIHPVNIGAGSVVDPIRFDVTTFDLKPTVQRFEEGNPNALGLVALEAALGLLEEIGIDRIADRVLSLGAYAARALEEKGYEIVTPREAGRLHSPLVTFRHPTVANDAALEALKQAGVDAAVRGGNVRIAPHFYNNAADIATAVAALPAG